MVFWCFFCFCFFVVVFFFGGGGGGGGGGGEECFAQAHNLQLSNSNQVVVLGWTSIGE